MEETRAIRIRSDRRRGIGTVFECDTRIGPFNTVDVMEITEWKARRRMGVRHVGTVTGEGVFTLRRVRGGRTRFTWAERLSFPWWLGGPIGAAIGGQVLRLIWKRNLGNLKREVENKK